MSDHKCIATEGLFPSTLSKVKKTLSIATLGLMCLSVELPPEILQPVSSGGNFTYLVDGDLIPRPYDMFRKKSIIVVRFEGKEYRAVVDRKLDINSIKIVVDDLNVNYPTAKIYSTLTSVTENKPIVETKLLEVTNEYKNTVEVKLI